MADGALNCNNSAADCSISLKYGTTFDHVTASGGARPGPAGARAPAGKGCAPADEMDQN